MQMQNKDKLSPRELSDRWGGHITIGTLANWRAQKPMRGPAFMKLGSRVVYPLNAVEEFEAGNSIAVAENDNTEGIKKNVG